MYLRISFNACKNFQTQGYILTGKFIHVRHLASARLKIYASFLLESILIFP
jgi:hypothetical protein